MNVVVHWCSSSSSFVLLLPMILSTAIASHFPLMSVREDLSFFTHLDRVDLSDNQLGSGLRTSGPQEQSFSVQGEGASSKREHLFEYPAEFSCILHKELKTQQQVMIM